MAGIPQLNITSTLPLLNTSAQGELRKSASIPVLGFGVYRIKSSTTTSESHCQKACEAALKAGYRHIDTARLYRNEPDVVEAVSRFCANTPSSVSKDQDHSGESDSVSEERRLTRDDIFLTTKIKDGTGDPERDYRAALKCVERLTATAASTENGDGSQTTPAKESAASRGAKRRKVDNITTTNLDTTPYVDLLLAHQPLPTLQERKSLWQALEKLHRHGRVRHIGVSNFRIEHIEEMKEYAEIWPPSVNQIEVHPWFQQKDLTAYCASHGIVVEAFAPLAQGKHFAKPSRKGSQDNDALEIISRKHDKTPAQVLIRWSLQKGFVVLPKSSNPERIRENANVFDFELDSQDMEVLGALDPGDRSGATYKWNKV